MKKNIDLIIDGIAPEKVMYDTDNHSLVVLYPAQREFKRGDILASDDALLIFDKYEMFKQERDLFHSIWNNWGVAHNKNWTTKNFKHATDEQKAQVYELLREEGKRWNKETLEIEDIKEEFKRGDIVIHDNTKRISVFDKLRNGNLGFDAIFGLSRFNDVHDYCSWNTRTLRHATPQEIEQFDNDLKQIGKKWNRELLQVEDLDISEIVVNLKTACKYLGKVLPHLSVCDFTKEDMAKFIAQITLQLIHEAWNKHDGFEVDWNDIEQEKYAPYRYADGGYLYAVNSSNWLGFESLIVFKSTERAIQFGNQFKELFKTATGL